MSSYAGLLQGLGNPLLSLLVYAEDSHFVWSSNGHSPPAAVQETIGEEIARLRSDDMAPATAHADPAGFHLNVLSVAEPNRAKLTALVLLGELPVSNGIAVPGRLIDAKQADAFLTSVQCLLLNELKLSSVARLPMQPAVTSGGEIALLTAVNARVRQYLQAQSSMQAEQVLQSVLVDCVEQLNVDSVTIYLKADNILLTAAETEQPESGNASLLRAMKKDILLFETNSLESKIRLGEELGESSENHDRLIMRIPDSLGRVMGLLSFIKKKTTEPSFSQNDQNVIELLVLPIEQIVGANYDAATGLLNAEGFYPKLGDILHSNEFAGFESCLLYIRFGQLISIGDNCGSVALNEAVVQLGAILEKRIRKRDLAARTASSDFLLYLNKCSTEDAEALCEDLLDTLKGYRFSYKDKLFSINAFIGVVPLARTERDVSVLLSAGEDACVEAMHQGINGFCVYQPKQRAANRQNGLIVWSDRIVETLRDEKLHLYTQSVVALRDLELIDHHEVLLRIKSDNSLLVAPSVFVRVAERSRLIEQVDHWVIKNTFENLNKLYSENADSRVSLSINISGATINESFPDFVSELMQDMAFQSDAIIFEITEASAISNMKYVVKAIKQMRLNGFQFSLDDFGAGMGSFVFLQNLAVDRLKIDGALIRGINRNDVNFAIVGAIQSVSKMMSLKTTAKLVDNEAMLGRLNSIGVDFVQGHLISKALPISQLVDPTLKKIKGLRG